MILKLCFIIPYAICICLRYIKENTYCLITSTVMKTKNQLINYYLAMYRSKIINKEVFTKKGNKSLPGVFNNNSHMFTVVRNSFWHRRGILNQGTKEEINDSFLLNQDTCLLLFLNK